MLKLLFGSIEKIVIAALIAALAYTTLTMLGIEDDLKSAEQTIKTKDLALDNMAAKVEFLHQSVDLSEQQNLKLIRERESLSRINQAYQSKLSGLTENLHKAQFEIDQLRDSSNETVNKWANDSVPCDAVRLLKYARAENCHKDGDGLRVHDTAKRISIEL